MKSWKRRIAFLLSVMLLSSLIGCKVASVTKEVITNDESADVHTEEYIEEHTNEPVKEEVSLKGAHVFMFKSMDNPFGELMYEGFQEYMEGQGKQSVYIAPEEPDAKGQIALLEELVEQDVASVTISASGDTGYEEVLEQAQEADIPVISVDSQVPAEYRLCHVNQATDETVGAYLVQAAVLIALEEPYPGDGKMEERLGELLPEYEGEELILGVLSSSEESPIQNDWLKAMEAELKKEMYKGKVSTALDVKYGEDDSVESKIQVGAFLREEKIDCLIAPTTIGIASAAEVLYDNNSKIKVTGLGLPSEMYGYMPTEDGDPFDSVCPYMMLWDAVHLGAVAAAAICAAEGQAFTGTSGETFEMDIFRDYDCSIYEVYTQNRGTEVLAGVPIVFYQGNIAEWKDVM